MSTVTGKPWFLDLARTMNGIKRPKTWPSQPAGSPALREISAFQRWHRWRPIKWKTPRPPDVWAKVPAWAWLLEAELGKLHATKPPAPIPPPPVTPPKPTLQLPIAYTAWGFRSGEFDGAKCAAKLAAGGFRSVAIQTDEGATRADVDAIRNAGFKVYLWDDLPYDPPRIRNALTTLGIDEADYHPQVESGPQLDRAVAYMFEANIGFHSAVVAGAGHHRGGIEQLINGGLKTTCCECYAPEGYPFSDLDRITWQLGISDGWPCPVAVLGLYHGCPPSAHAGLDRWWPEMGGVWLLETMQPGDYTELQAA